MMPKIPGKYVIMWTMAIKTDEGCVIVFARYMLFNSIISA